MINDSGERKAGHTPAPAGETAAEVPDLPKSCCSADKEEMQPLPPARSLQLGPSLLPALPPLPAPLLGLQGAGLGALRRAKGPSPGWAGSGTREPRETAAAEQSTTQGWVCSGKKKTKPTG